MLGDLIISYDSDSLDSDFIHGRALRRERLSLGLGSGTNRYALTSCSEVDCMLASSCGAYGQGSQQLIIHSQYERPGAPS